jgi:hypothetical protein
MKTTISEKFLAYLTLISGLAISGVAVYYSVVGLTSIFAAAFVPIIIMGVALEVSKLVATTWLKQNWEYAPKTIKAYLISAIAILMLITSMGIFGYLSKAHLDQNLVSGEVVAKIAVYDEKIKTEKENIDANRKSLKQMDEAVDQVMARSTSEEGASRSVAVRRSQQKERTRLIADITASQQRIATLNEERAPIAAEVRKVEAEVGPIKYIANFFYGSADPAVLEKAVTWVIIILIAVFDPLAVVLLLASQISFQQFRRREQEADAFFDKARDVAKELDNGTYTSPDVEELNTILRELQKEMAHETGTDDPIDFPKYEPDDGQLTENQIQQIKNLIKENDAERIVDNIIATFPTDVEEVTPAPPVELETVDTPPVPTKIKRENAFVRTKVFSRPIMTNATPVEETPVDTVEETVDFIFPHSDQGRGSLVEQLPGAPDSVEETPVVQNNTVVRPTLGIDSLYSEPVEPATPIVDTYVQNEEQIQSNLWSSTTSSTISQNEYVKTSQERFDDTVDELVEQVKSGQIRLDEVDPIYRDEVSSKL